MDAHRQAALLAAGVKAADVARVSERDALDDWLDAPSAEVKSYEDAVRRELGG